MSSPVHVRSVAALEDLKGALARFRAEVQGILQAARQEIGRTEGWLQRRLAYWQAEMQQRQKELIEAEAALARCRGAGYYDRQANRHYTPPCIAEQQAVRQAWARLQKAQVQLDKVRHWKYRLDEAASAFNIHGEQLSRLLSGDLPNAVRFLGSRTTQLEAYLAAAPSAATPAWPPSSHEAEGGVIAPFPTGAGISPSSQGGTGSGGAGVHRGINIQIVDLEQIDQSDSPVTGPDDFRKVSAQEMQEGLRKLLDVVMPAVAQGKDSDYFSELDAAQGLDYAHGYRRIYDAFYGHDCICLERVRDRYHVINGYHRLFLAQRMGIKALPARIIGPQP